MKILALGDPHGELPKNLNKIIKKNKVKIIICIGDIAPAPVIPKKGETFKQACKRAEKTYEKIIDKLCSFNLPVLTLRGNVFTNTRENNKVTHKIFAPHKNLFHKKIGKLKVEEINFIFFDMIYEKHAFRNPKGFKKKHLTSLKFREKKLNALLKKQKDAVVLSHSPPFEVLDKLHIGKHVGSKVLLKAIKKHKPRLVLSGHIHEAKGKAKIGKTEVYNLGYKGEYKILNLSNKK